jgi:hypothetical protein
MFDKENWLMENNMLLSGRFGKENCIVEHNILLSSIE